MSSAVAIDGYAIVSADDRIADAEGRMPAALMNDADWAYFQAELDRCDLVALGRASHAATPNARGRRRLVISRAAVGLAEQADAWWWNPAAVGWPDVAARLLPRGGRVGVPGGQVAFDLFAAIGFSSFHLSRANRVLLPGGRGLFSAVDRGAGAEAVLAGLGLVPGATVAIDPAADVALTIWRSMSAGGEGSLPPGAPVR